MDGSGQLTLVQEMLRRQLFAAIVSVTRYSGHEQETWKAEIGRILSTWGRDNLLITGGIRRHIWLATCIHYFPQAFVDVSTRLDSFSPRFSPSAASLHFASLWHHSETSSFLDCLFLAFLCYRSLINAFPIVQNYHHLVSGPPPAQYSAPCHSQVHIWALPKKQYPLANDIQS
jgi:hypothetical protein